MVMSPSPADPPTVLPKALSLYGTILFLLLAVFGFLVGLRDAVGAGEFADKLMGLSFFIGALGLIAAMPALWGKRAHRSMAVMGSILATAIPTTMAIAQWTNLEHDLRLGTWLCVSMLGLTSFILLRLAKASLSIKGLTTYLSAGALVTVGQFWYTNQYVPFTISPALNVTTQTERIDATTATDGAHPLSVSVTVKNISKALLTIMWVTQRPSPSFVRGAV